MTGPDLIALLMAEGFTVSRRSKALVWLVRGAEQLLIDSEADVAEALAQEILTRARASGKPPPP
jgi:ribosomal protein S7